MPVGNTEWHQSDAPVVVPAKPSTPARADYWAHFTIDPDDQWDPCRVHFDLEVVKFELYAAGGDELWIGLGSDVIGSPPNLGYSAYHPGGGQLVLPTQPIKSMTLRAATSAGPAERVELYVYAGLYAVL